MPRRNRCYLSPYCTSDSPTDGNERYFCIPKVKVGPICEVTKKLSQKRRSLWLKILGLTEAETEGKDRVLVCSRHFVSGQPDYEMYEKSVDWVPTLNIPLPKIIIIPPPTEEHSYCQKSLPPIAYNWKTSVSGTNKRIIQRRSHRVTILKKKKEKAIKKAIKAQQKAEAIAEKIREKRQKKKLLALKKAKKEEKIKRAKKEAILLLKQAYEKNNKPEPMLNQIESIDIAMPLNPPQSNLLLSNEDHLLKRTSEGSKNSDVLRRESIAIGINGIVNKLPSTSDISVSPKITDDLPINIRTEPTAELHHSERDLDVESKNKVTNSSEKITSKNEFLQQLMLSQIGQSPKRKLAQVRIAPETRSSDALKRAAEPIKNTAKLPSKIFILRKDASDNTSRTVITLKSPGNASGHPVQKNAEKIIKQIKPSPSSSATPQQQTKIVTNSPKVVSSTTPILKKFAASPLKILQPTGKIMIPRNGVAAKTPLTITKPTPSANPPCRVVSKNTDVVNRVQVMKPKPVPREMILQSLRNVEAYIRDLIRQKKVSSQESQARSLLQKLIENHQKINIDTETLVPTAQIVESNQDKEIIDLTKDDCDYILPDAAPNKLCPACSCRNSIEEISFLRSELGKKSIELESCRNDLDSLKKELCEAKNFISNLSAQLQENTQALCSYLANSNQQAI